MKLDGRFFYTPIYYELLGLRDDARTLDDEELLDVVQNLVYDSNNDDRVGDIIYNFWHGLEDLSEEDRTYLEWFYVNAWCEYGIEGD